MKKILIMGGGINQLPLIEAAKSVGYYTILCDGYCEPAGREYADAFYQIDISDHTKVEDIAKIEKVDGIVANTESLMVCLAKAQTNCGFVANPPEAVDCFQNKTKFRELQRNLQLVAPKSICTDDWQVALDEMLKMKFPIIMKPTQSSGSRGTRRINSFSDVKEGDFVLCKELSRNDHVTVEEFIERPDNYILQGEFFVWDGIIELFIFYRTQMSSVNPYVSGHHSFPYVIDEKKFSRMKEVLQKIVTENHINYGEYNVESYFISNDEYFVIEINARQAGEEIPRSIKYSMDIDLYRLLVMTSVGDTAYLDELRERFGKEQIPGKPILDCKLCTDASGIYKGHDCGVLQNRVVDVIEHAVPNKTFFEVNKETIQTVAGYVILAFDTCDELYSYADPVWDNVKVIVE